MILFPSESRISGKSLSPTTKKFPAELFFDKHQGHDSCGDLIALRVYKKKSVEKQIMVTLVLHCNVRAL